MNSSELYIKNLNNFVEQTQHACEQFAQNLKKNAEEFYMKIAENPNEDEQNIFHCNFMSNFILNTAYKLNEVQQDIQEEAIDPLLQFIQNFEETNKQINQSALNYINEVERKRNEMGEIHENYLKCKYKLYKHEKDLESFKKNSSEKEQYSHDLAEKMGKQAYLKELVDDKYIEYKNSLVDVNREWQRFDEQFKNFFFQFDLNEESRINFTKSTVAQLLKNLDLYFGSYQEETNNQHKEKYFDKVKIFDSQKQFQKGQFLNNILRSRKINIFQIDKKEHFISFEDWLGAREAKEVKSKINSEELSQYKIKKNNKEYLEQINDYLKALAQEKENKDLSKIKKKLQECDLQLLFKDQKIRKQFIEEQGKNYISIRKNQKYIQLNKQDFQYVTEVFYNLAQATDNDRENFTIHDFSIILNNLVLYTKDPYPQKNIIIYLGREISNDVALFYDREIWKKLLLYIRDQKDQLLSPQKIEKKKKGGFKSFFKKNLGQLLQKSEDEKDKQKEKEKSSTNNSVSKNRRQNIFEYNNNLNILDEVSNVLVKINLKVQVSQEILIYLSKEFKIRINDIIPLLEIQENRKFLEQSDVKISRSQRKQMKIQKKLDKYDQQKWLYCVLLSLPYLDPQKDFMKLFLINKSVNKNLHDKIRKYSLIDIKLAENQDRRKAIWKSMLNSPPQDFDFKKLEEEYEEKKLTVQNQNQVEELIRLDVLRSFQNSDEGLIDHKVLTKLLNVYSIYNQKIQYCQGMNFLMGFILIYFKDEETSINIFAQIIDQTLQKILENNITYINVLFYKLNRLLQIYVPEVAEHLKQLKIEAGHFSTPWFLTIFTSNCFSSRGYGEIIYEIWDIYLSQRWKGMFKIIIVIFQFYEETILKMKFDELMSFLNNLVKSEFYQSKEIIKPNKEQQSETIKYLNLDKIQPLYGLKSKVDKIDLSEKLLDTLETEHKVMKGAINNIIDKQYQKK